MPTSTLDEDSIEISSSERFQPRNDGDDELWDVKAIISEKAGYYKVEWAGVDPATGKKWPASWVRKGDVTDDLVKKWKLKKKQQQEEKAARKRRKSGKRDSAMSAALASRSNSTRGSASALTPATSVSESRRVSRQPDVIPAVSRNGKLTNHETHSSPPAHHASPKFKEASPLLEELENLKRKRDSSIGSVSIASLPQIAAVSHSPPVTRPRKKRRLGSTYDLQEISEEDTAEIQRPTENGWQVVVDDEGEEEVQQKRAKEISSASKKKSGRKSEQLKKGRTREEEQEQEVMIRDEDDDEVEVVSSPPKGAKSRPQPRPVNGPKKRVSNVSPIPGLSPTRQRKDSNDANQRAQQTNGVTQTRSKEANHEPSVWGPLDDARRKPTPRRRTRELSPATLGRLKRFDAELDELERERKRQEFNAKDVEEEDESGLEYISPAVPVSSLPTRSSPNFVPASQPTELVPQHPQRHSAPKIPINEKITDGSFRQGIVPETEPEDFSANTQSQSQPISQPVPSLPSMVVEPPTSLRSRPSTPSQAQTSKSRPGSSDARSKPSVREQPDSQDADISTPFDSIEPESQEVPSPSKPTFYPTTAQALPSADSSNRTGADELTSSIEQFSSPEKPRVEKGKRREPNGRERSPAESATIRRRGQQLAETARLARLHSRPQANKRPLSEVIAQQVQHSRSVLKNGLPPTSVPHAALSSTLESVPSFPNSISHIVADSNRGMPEVPEEVVQELEAALIDLDGGTNKQTEDDTLEDRSTSLQKSSNDSVMTNTSSVFALRQEEEEESTQDLLREAAVAAEEVQVTKIFDAEMDNEQPIPIPPRNQERQPSREVEPARGSPRLAQAHSPSVVSAGAVGPPQCDLGKQAPLDGPSSPLEPPNSELREIKAVYDRDRAEWQAELASLKAEWEAERASLAALAETAAKAKEGAIKETNFFREQYARASAFVTSVRDENVELEKRAKITEDQAKSGVAMVKATFESRIKELEQHVEKWQMMASFLMQKDQRTENDELRRRAAEEPELRARCETQEEDINALSSEIIRLEDKLELREKMVKDWEQEADQLAEQLNDCKAEVERLTQAAVENEMVYRCLWRLETEKPCEEVFSSAEDLKAHLYSAGHMTWD